MKRKNTTFLSNLVQTCIEQHNTTFLSTKLLHAHILRTNLFFIDTFVANRLISLYSNTNSIYAQRVYDQMPQRDIYTHNTLLSTYCKARNFEQVDKVFGEMPERDGVSWNMVLSALVRNGLEEKGLVLFREMVRKERGIKPARFSLTSVFSACGVLADLGFGRVCHGIVVKIGLDGDVYVSNGLMWFYAKCKLVDNAVKILHGMFQPNEVSFTTMMIGFAENDRLNEALEIFRLMCINGIKIDAVSLSSVLGVCAKGGCGKQVHSLTIKLGFDTDLHLSNSLLDMYAKNGDMHSAEMIFANLNEVSVFSWNVMIAGYGDDYQSENAIDYMKKMQCLGFVPNEVTFINTLAACVKSRDIENALKIFKSMKCPSLTSWNSILSGHSKCEKHEEAIMLFREMQFQSVRPDQTTFAIILSICAEMGFLESGKQVHAASLKTVFHSDVFISSGLIGMYSKCWKTDKANVIFDRLCILDTVCWNSMMAGFSFNSLDNEAFVLFKRMRENGICFPSEFTYATILSSCASLSCSSQGREVHAQITKDGYETDIFVSSSLINMYCKCGDVDVARLYFDRMPFKNTVIWNEMINGYARNGLGIKAVSLYEDMIVSGQIPDAITFVSVLTACSHSGLVDAGFKMFNSMQLNYGIEPLYNHYTCIIDLLGRAGRFDEIEVIIDKLPCKDDSMIWEILLSSCRLHDNVQLARRAAEELLRINPQNSSPYLLLANSYASMGGWENAMDARGLMSSTQVNKQFAAYSYIQYENFKTMGDEVVCI